METQGHFTLMIAEDHKLMRRELANNILENTNNIEITGSAENGQVLLELVRKNTPDIVLLDLKMPVMDGNEVLEVFKSDYPDIKTIIYSSDYSDYHVAKAVLNGAAAYVDKMNGDISDIITAIQMVCEHGYYFNEAAAQEIILALQEQKKFYFLIENKRFSSKEIEIIQEICKNKQIKQIAADLNIHPGTVKYHKGKLLKKTKSEATVDLVIYAIRQGIFNPAVKKRK